MLNPWLFDPSKRCAESSIGRADTTVGFSHAQFKANTNTKRNRNTFKQQPVTPETGWQA